MAESKIALATVLREVRNAIRQAHEDAMAEAAKDPTKMPVMRFKECEVEFALDVEMEVGGGIKLWVLKLGAGRTRTESNTIKITYDAHGDVMVAKGLSDDPNLSSAKRQQRGKRENK